MVGKEISALEVGLMLAAMKIVRETYTHSEDNLVDIAGYAACCGEVVDDGTSRR